MSAHGSDDEPNDGGGEAAPFDLDRTILIVTGAHLRAEATDRPLAYRLREQMLQRRDDQPDPVPLDILVCSDLWYLNADELRSRPTISIGAPGVNALTAYLGDKLPAAFVIDGVLCVQLDPEFGDLIAACWGHTPSATASAIDAFVERYLEQFMHHADLRQSAA